MYHFVSLIRRAVFRVYKFLTGHVRVAQAPIPLRKFHRDIRKLFRHSINFNLTGVAKEAGPSIRLELHRHQRKIGVPRTVTYHIPRVKQKRIELHNR